MFPPLARHSAQIFKRTLQQYAPPQKQKPLASTPIDYDAAIKNKTPVTIDARAEQWANGQDGTQRWGERFLLLLMGGTILLLTTSSILGNIQAKETEGQFQIDIQALEPQLAPNSDEAYAKLKQLQQAQNHRLAVDFEIKKQEFQAKQAKLQAQEQQQV